MYHNQEFEKTINKSLVEELNQPEKFEFIIDLQKFHNMCYEINTILSKYDYFLRVFELKNKFRQLLMKDKSKQKIVRQLSSCLIEKYSDFQVISIEFERKQRKKFKPINIIYKLTKRVETEPLCYFYDDISKHICIFIQKEKTEWEEGINAISVIIVINLIIKKLGKKDIWNIVQEAQELFIILITKT